MWLVQGEINRCLSVQEGVLEQTWVLQHSKYLEIVNCHIIELAERDQWEFVTIGKLFKVLHNAKSVKSL